MDPRATGWRVTTDLWRGIPFADLDVLSLRGEAARLEEARAVAIEQRIELASLAYPLGPHGFASRIIGNQPSPSRSARAEPCIINTTGCGASESNRNPTGAELLTG